MASYYCPTCDDHYPNAPDFNYCPTCETYTVYRSAKPDVSKEDCKRRVVSKRNREAFKAWCEDNDRVEPDMWRTIRLIRGGALKDIEYAQKVIDALESDPHVFPVGELWVA